MIKPYISEDYTSIYNIWVRSVEATHDFLSHEDFVFYKEIVPKYFSQTSIYIFEENGFIKGFLGISNNHIEMLFVDPKYIGTGIGKSLLLYAIRVLKISSVDVNEQNVKALQFYIKFGFDKIGRSETDSMGKHYPITHLRLSEL